MGKALITSRWLDVYGWERLLPCNLAPEDHILPWNRSHRSIIAVGKFSFWAWVTANFAWKKGFPSGTGSLQLWNHIMGLQKAVFSSKPLGDPLRLPMGHCTGNLLPWQHPAAPLHDCLFEFFSSSEIFDSRLRNHPSVNPWLWLFTHPWNQRQSDLSYLCLFVSLFIQASQVALAVKNPPANAGNVRDTGVIPASERSRRRAWQPRPVFENPMDRGLWQVTVQGVEKNQTWLKQLSMHTHTHTHTHTISLSKGMSHSLPPSLLLSLLPLPYD